ncbi:MAG: DNA polymerase III subunit beta [Desulfobacca sp.]|uniref:DNA polymerase III subunit beta n=1 Tax=Desulfobacca sp. TaxID=2067990 RepID=UPI004048F944
MKLEIDRDTLLQGIGRTQGVIDRRSHTPILAHCLLEATADRLKISATDYEISYRGFYPALVSEEGGMTVPASNFFGILKELPAGTLSLASTPNNSLQVLMGEMRYQFMGLGPDNFPPLPTVDEQILQPLKATVVREMLEKTIFSVSLDDLQPQLTGVYAERLPESGYLRFVSSDSHRLSLVDREVAMADQLDLEKGILIPRKGVVEMLRFLEGEDCALGLEKKNLVLKQGEDYLFIRLLDKKFPDYRRILPETAKLQLAVPRKPFLEILKRMSLLSSERFKGLILTVNEGWLDLRYHNPDVGGGEERLPLTVKSLAPSDDDDGLTLPLEVSYNARYLIEPLAVMQGEEILMELYAKKRPLCLRDPDDPYYLSIVMPMDV